MTRRTKQLIAAFHWVLGLIILVPLLIASVSGTALVFREELENGFESGLYQVQPQHETQSLDALTEAVKRHTDTPVSYLSLPSGPERSAEFVLIDETVVFVNPYTAEVMGDRHLYGGPAGWLFNLHSRLFSGATGETIMGVMGIAVLLLFFSGFTVWLWHKHPIRRKLQIKFSGSGRRTVFDLHRVGGVLAGILLGLSAATGAGLVFYNMFSQVTHTFAEEPVPEYPVLPVSENSEEVFSATEAAKAAREALPGAELKRIVWPTSQNRVAQIRFRQNEEVHPNGMSFVYLDSGKYSVVTVQEANEAKFPVNINHWLYPIHSGKWAAWWDFILILTGAGGILITVTGFLNVRNMKWPKS